jgi:DNA-directed RNA polymerase sigma subunit (sigma70/sigma32)
MDDFCDDPVQIYLREVAVTPPLTGEQEAECIRHVLAGDREAERAGEDLVEANLALVVEIAQRYPNERVHVLDLIQEGNNALLRALKTFRESREESFSAHAERAISEAVAAATATGGS